MRMRIIILIFILLDVYKIYAQDSTKIKSLQHDLLVAKDDTSKVNALNQLGWEYHNANTDSAMYYVKAALLIAEKVSAQKQIATAKFYIGRLYYNKSDDDSAIKSFDDALTINEALNNIHGIASAHMYKGYVYYHMNRMADMLNEFLMSLKYAEQSGDKKAISDALYSVGDYYLHNKAPDSVNALIAKTYFLQALNIDKELDLKSNIATDYEYLGDCYMYLHNFTEAEKNLRLGLAFFEKLNDEFHVGTSYSYLANLYGAKNNIDLSIENYQNAEKIFERLGSNLEASDVSDNIAMALYKKKDYTNALNIAQHGLEIAKQVNAMQQMFYLYISLAKISGALKDFNKAYGYQVQATALKDTINENEQRDKLDELQTKYETEQKDKAIKLLNTQTKLDKEQISRQHILELFSVISIVLIMVLSIVLLNRNRIKQQLKEVNVRNQLAADLHDEVGSSLSSILLLSKMAAEKADAESKKSMLEKISGNTKDVIDRMGDIVWMMNPKYDEGENLREKLEQYIARIKDVASFRVYLEIDAAIDVIKFPMEIRKTIFLIFKEAINNTLKYAEATSLSISLKLIEKNVQLKIADKGEGFDKEKITSGNGLDTMALRTKNCKGIFKIESEENKGTIITATIPIPHFR